MASHFALALCALVAMVNGMAITPTNWTSADQSEKSSDSVGISVSVGDDMKPLGPILALTTRAQKGIPPTGLSGPVFLLDPSSQLQLVVNDIAFISCDPYPGEIQVDTIYGLAEKTNVTAIVLYTQLADYCNLEDSTGSFSWIYSTKSRAETTQLLNSINSPDPNPDGQVYASINTLDSARPVNGTAGGGHSGSSQGDQNKNPLGPSPSTAVAMIILYSITGIITALFLIIIITGAIRAHRHPERYGPRNITGRPRQSRARGLARAIVETLPIVKFGEQQEPKPADVELADSTTNRRQSVERSEPATASDTQEAQVEQQNLPRESVEGGIAAATSADQATAIPTNPDNLGCSICTEDFEAGQDQRVLPCDHRFHPDCIDPWLLNVSGTCPLCRIDLRPQTADSLTELDENGNPVVRDGDGLPPPLAAGQPPRMGIRRSLLIGLMGVRGPDRMTSIERVHAARQLRAQHVAQTEYESRRASLVITTQEREQREQSRRARLRSLFGIRTRRTGQAEEPARPDDELEPGPSSPGQDEPGR